MNIPFHDLRPQYLSIEQHLRAAVDRVFASGHFILGTQVAELEREFAAYCDVEHAVAVASGTDALWIGLLALGIQPGDEVVTAANTAFPTVAAISKAGAIPILADVDPVTYNLDPEAVEGVLTPRTRAIIPVHLYGQPANMGPLISLARNRGIRLLEDSCQAHGARYCGRRTGALGDAAAFSFYPTKNLGAYGDGGLVVTGDANVADQARLLRDYGQCERYHHIVQGYNSRLDELQAAILRVKLGHLDDWNGERRRKAQLYTSLLRGITTPTEMEGNEHVYHLYVIRHPQRDALRKYLADRHIGTMIHYPRPVHLQPAYQSLGLHEGRLPVAESCAREILSLPLYPELSDEHVAAVASAVNDFAS